MFCPLPSGLELGRAPADPPCSLLQVFVVAPSLLPWRCTRRCRPLTPRSVLLLLLVLRSSVPGRAVGLPPRHRAAGGLCGVPGLHPALPLRPSLLHLCVRRPVAPRRVVGTGVLLRRRAAGRPPQALPLLQAAVQAPQPHGLCCPRGLLYRAPQEQEGRVGRLHPGPPHPPPTPLLLPGAVHLAQEPRSPTSVFSRGSRGLGAGGSGKAWPVAQKLLPFAICWDRKITREEAGCVESQPQRPWGRLFWSSCRLWARGGPQAPQPLLRAQPGCLPASGMPPG